MLVVSVVLHAPVSIKLLTPGSCNIAVYSFTFSIAHQALVWRRKCRTTCYVRMRVTSTV
jgi:hypothetical protein